MSKHEHNHDHDHDNFIILTDEEGNETEFEIVASFDMDENEYAVLFPAHGDSDEGYIFRVKDDGEEAVFENIEGDEFDKVAEYYYSMIEDEDFNEEDEEDEE